MLAKAPIESIPEENLQMADKLERSGRHASAPFVERECLTLVAISEPEIRSHSWLREHVPDRPNVDLDR
jgi:hypothetical protein